MVFVSQSTSIELLKSTVIGVGDVRTTFWISLTGSQPFSSTITTGYIPSDKSVKHQLPLPLSIQLTPIGIGLLPPVIEIQIDPLLKLHSGSELQFGCIISISTKIGSGSLITTNWGPK